MDKNFPTFEHFEQALDKAIDNAMQTYVSDRVKKEIQQEEDARVYSYEPQYWHRRYTAGGLADTSLMKDDYNSSNKELTITIDAPWQQLKPGGKPSVSLAEAVESGLNMYGAGARPFVHEAEEAYAKGSFEDDLNYVLMWSGMRD